MSKVILQGHILVPKEQLKEIKEALVTHTRLTIMESGCLTFEVTQDETNENKFKVYEEFTDQVAFENHQSRVRNSNWGKVTQQVERHYQIHYCKK